MEALALRNVGINYRNRGQYKESLSYFQRSGAIFTDIGQERDLARNISEIARVYENQMLYAEALSYYLNALDMEESNSNDSGIAYVSNRIGIIYSKLNRLLLR